MASYNREIMAIVRINTTVWATSHRTPSNVKTKSIIINPLKPELNPICYLLALLGPHHFLHVSRI